MSSIKNGNMDNGVKQTAIKYGLIIGGISVTYILMAYSFDMGLLVSWGAGLGLSLTSIVLLIIGVVSLKRANGGYISFRSAFSTYILAYLISALINVTFSYVLFGVVDKEAAAELTEMTIETTVGFLENVGTPEETIEQTIEELEKTDQYSLINLIKGTGFTLIFSAIVALIVAAATKKDEPIIFEETTEEA